jgi:hypothetical protein
MVEKPTEVSRTVWCGANWSYACEKEHEMWQIISQNKQWQQKWISTLLWQLKSQLLKGLQSHCQESVVELGPFSHTKVNDPELVDRNYTAMRTHVWWSVHLSALLITRLIEEIDCKEDTPLTLPFASFVSLSQLIIVIWIKTSVGITTLFHTGISRAVAAA